MAPTIGARLALLGTVLALSGCAEKDPQPEPRPAQIIIQTAPPPEQAGPPPKQDDRVVIITSKPFPEEVMSILPGDLVEVTLTNGGRTSGWVTALRPRELAVTAEGTRIISRLTPEVVRSVKITYRPPRLIGAGDGAAQGREAWLEPNLQRLVLEALPQEAWGGLFGRNVALVVSRQFQVSGWDHLEQGSDRHLFAALDAPVTLLPGDELKLTLALRGAEKQKSGERLLGDVYVLLHKRGDRVTQLFTTDPLHPSDLDRQSLVRYLAQEPVTMVVYRPVPPVTYAKIARVSRNTARVYMQRVELLPERAILRQMRASKDPALEKIEGQIKTIHDALGLAPDDPLRNGPLVMEMRLPTLHGALFLLPFRKEFGLD